MTLHIHNVTFDCADARALGSFWGELLGWNVYYDEGPEVVVARIVPELRPGSALHPRPRGQRVLHRARRRRDGPRHSRAFRITG